MPGWLFKLLVGYAENQAKKEKLMHGGTMGMEAGPGDRLDYSGLTIKIIKAQNGTIIEYTSIRDGDEKESALSARNMVSSRPIERRLYIVPEGVKLADAVLAVVALMRLE